MSKDFWEDDAKPSSGSFWEDDIMSPRRIPIPVGESALSGAAQGATFGFADEATAGAMGLKDYLAGKLGQRGDIDLSDAYRTNLNAVRKKDAMAQAENPKAFGAGQIGGGIASSFLPGVGALNTGKGAGLAVKVGKGAASGALTGAGMSEANPLHSPREAMNFGEDVIAGAATGGATAGLLHGAGKVVKSLTPTNVAKKSANVLLGTPEELTDIYIKNPEGVKSAAPRYQLAQKYQQVLDDLKDNVVSGSKESRDILDKEGGVVKGSEIAKILTAKADEILARSEGVMDDPKKLAAYNWLRNTAKQYAPKMTEATESSLLDASGKKIVNPGGSIDRDLSTNRVKDLLQGIDNQTDFETGPGQFSRIDDIVKKNVRSDVDALLKGRSSAYEDQMKGVAADASLLSEASDIAKNPAAMANVLKRIETDQYGGGQLPRDVLSRVDKRMGTNILKEAKMSNAREAFDKSASNGSRNVSMFSNALKDIPVIKHLAPVLGGSVDKYGRKMTMSAVDLAVKLNRLYQTEGAQNFAEAVRPLVDAARQGNASAIATMQFLTKTNPDAIRAIQEGE